MDAKIIGKRISALRKNAGWTQAELASKLNVGNKAVSKWEVGGGFPDMEQLDNITKVFGISFNDLLGSEELKMPDIPVVEENDDEKSINDDWYKLDNAAKVYPNDLDGKSNAIFRIATVMKEEVDPEILQQALIDCVGRFPTMMVTLRKGVFWYYFEPVKKLPRLHPDLKYPMREFLLDGRDYLFRVCYSKNKIAVEFFHSITDGNGGIIFFNTLISRYYELKYGKIEEIVGGKCIEDLPTEGEVDDSFLRYYKPGGKTVRGTEKAFHLKGVPTYKNRTVVTHLIMDADKLNAYSKTLGATVNEFLTAVILNAIYKRARYEKKCKNPVVLQVPINLRKFFPSETLRNFSLFVNVKLDIHKRDYTFEEILKEVHTQIKSGLNEEFLLDNISANVKDEKSFFIRFVPLTIKRFILNFAKVLYGSRNTTISFSNLGRYAFAPEVNSIVDRMETSIKPDTTAGIVACCVTCNNKCVFTVTRSFKERYFEKLIAQELVERGLDVYVEGNHGGKHENL